jgi:hypothetical protein
VMQCLQNLNIENYDLSKSFMEEGDGNKSVNSHLNSFTEEGDGNKSVDSHLNSSKFMIHYRYSAHSRAQKTY